MTYRLPGLMILMTFLTLGFSQEKFRYQILPESSIQLEGNTNVTPFECISFHKYEINTIQWQAENQTPNCLRVFSLIHLPVATLDCGQSMMNKDMREALQYQDYPHISLELIQIFRKGEVAQSVSQEETVNAKLLISIAGKKRAQSIIIDCMQKSENIWCFSGSCRLKMTDYGIDPPTAMLGMVRVEDEIQIRFSMFVEVWAN